MRQKNDCVRLHLSVTVLLFLISFGAFAQKSVTGKVVSSKDNTPLQSATVTVKGTKVATLTDANGNFAITMAAGKSTLIISSIGYTNLEVDASSGTVEVALVESATSLDEIVVTGYTSQRKKDITGAVTVVDVKNVKAQPSSDVGSQLQGHASGVTVIQDGVPGKASTVRIRGLGSFSNNSPLYVVDGVQTFDISGINPNDIESIQVLKDAASAGIYGVRGTNGVIIVTTKKARVKGNTVNLNMYYGIQDPGHGMDMLNAQEEGQLFFLSHKNAGKPTTGSVYGDGPSPVLPDYVYYTGYPLSTDFGKPILKGNPNVDPSLYSLDYNQLGNTGYSPYIIVPTNKTGTDWYDVATRTAPIQSYNLSMSGATDNSHFLLSLNYFDQKAITYYQFFKRYTVRLNSDFNVLKFFKVGENLQVYSSEGNVPDNFQSSTHDNNSEASVIANTFKPMAILPVYTIKPGDFAGNIGGPGPGLGTWGNAKNPLADLYYIRNNRSNNINIFGNVYAELNLTHGFTFRSSFGGGLNTNNWFRYPFIEYQYNENIGNTTYQEEFNRGFGWIWTNLLTYKNSFGKHDITAFAGQEAQKGGGSNINGSGTGYFTYNNLPFINLSNGITPGLSGSHYTPTTLESFFAQVNYTYDDKYILSALFRRDGSSKFLGDNKWANFPAFSVGWRLSQEEFMKNISWLNEFKIRGSWGQLGNEAALQPQNSFTTFGANRQSSFYDINGTQTAPADGFNLNFNGNPTGQWEKGTTTNIGFDATVIKNSTQIVFDWYQKKTSGLLYNPQLAGIYGGASSGNNPAYFNVGSMENHGLDISLDNHANISRDLSLNTTLTFTTYKNKITAINGTQQFFDFNSPANEQNRIGAPATRNFVGSPINTYYGYKVIGLFQSADEVAKSPIQTDAAPGRFKYADIDGNDTIDTRDREIIGNPNPDFTYGINLSVQYKGFDLAVFFYGVAGKDAFNFTKWFTDFTPGTFPGGRSKRTLYDSWLPDGSRPNATTPIQELNYGTGFSDNNQVNSYFVENASYFRLRNLQIGYTIPASTLSRVKISSIRIYLQATNVFTITKYTGFNPDIVTTDERSAGVDFGAYPTVRQYLVGLNVNF